MKAVTEGWCSFLGGAVRHWMLYSCSEVLIDAFKVRFLQAIASPDRG